MLTGGANDAKWLPRSRYAARVESKFATVNGVRLNYGEGPANGPTVVYLPGFPDTWQEALPILAMLESDHHVFAPTHRGLGESEHAAPYRIADWVADAAAFIREVAGAPVLGIGHSAGSWFGLSAAGKEPDLFRAFISLDQPLDPAVHVANHQRNVPVYGGIAAAMRAGTDREDLARRLGAVPSTLGGTWSDHEAEAELLEDADFFGAADPAIFDAWERDDLAGWLLVPELQRWPGAYTGPLLFCDGDPGAGSLVTPAAQAYNRERYPWAERVQIPGANHMLGMADHPDMVATEARRFFSRLG